MISTIDHPHALSGLRYLREIPLLWFWIGCLMAQMGLVVASPKLELDRYITVRRIAIGAGLLVLGVFACLTLFSLHCFVIQQDEANLLSISAATVHGLPMYNLPRSADSSYSLMYGPLTFLIYRLALLVGGINHFWIIRCFVASADLSAVAAIYCVLRRFLSPSVSLALLAFPISALIQHPEISLSARSDIWILLLATSAILVALRNSEWPAVFVVGVIGGLIVDFKITAASALLFPLLLLYRRFGWRTTIAASAVATAVTLLPFTLPYISLHNYIAWLLFTRSEGFSMASVIRNVAFALFLISPCLIVQLALHRTGTPRRNRLPEVAVIFACIALALLTSKNGSGPHYLWHIIPSIVLYLALLCDDLQSVSATKLDLCVYYIAVASMVFACVNTPRAWQNVRMSFMPPGVPAASRSIQQYLALYAHNSSLQVGYGSVDGDYHSELRYIPIYRGQPYTIEGNTGRFETRILPFPVNVLQGMQTCKDNVWLIPHAQSPFQLWVLPDSLRSTFVRNYSIDRTDGIYDAWVCNRAKLH